MKTKSVLFVMLGMLLYESGFDQTTINVQADVGGTYSDKLIRLAVSKNKNEVLFAGYSLSNQSIYKSQGTRGGYDYWVIKASLKNDRSIRKSWDKTIGGNGSDILTAAIATNDGGYLLGGNSNSEKSGEKSENTYGGYDYWIVKIDVNGNIQWDKTIGGISNYDYLRSLGQAKDGGYILIGSLGLTKLDKYGNTEWQKNPDANQYYTAGAITKDGGCIVLVNSTGLMKMDDLGNVQWFKQGIGLSYLAEGPQSVIQTADGGYVFNSQFAWSHSESGDYYYDYQTDIYKTDSLGNKQWTYSDYPYAVYYDAENCGLMQTADGGFIYGLAYSTSVYYISGYSKYHIDKLDKDGHLQWSHEYDGNVQDVLTDVAELIPGHYSLGGYSSSAKGGDKTKENLGYEDYWVLAVTDTTATNVSINSITAFDARTKEIRNNILVYPNPAKDILHIQTNGEATFTLTNQSGKVLLTKTITNKGEINVSNLVAGLYYLKNNTTDAVQKVVVTK